MSDMAGTSQDTLYDTAFVRATFDEMAATYGLVNLVSSFGFARWWREQCVQQIRLETGMTVGDWMCGMGEAWHIILRSIRAEGAVLAVDLSPAMCERARQQPVYREYGNVVVREQNILENDLPDASADCIVSTFGLKTFSPAQQGRLASEIARVLRPGGQCALIEVSVPPSRLLRLLYLLYLKVCIPLIGALLLGNPDNYRLLGVYTVRFQNCQRFASMLERNGLQVQYQYLRQNESKASD
jgi:ubiquinone/menaquinone biosynthesis methyltransferase